MTGCSQNKQDIKEHVDEEYDIVIVDDSGVEIKLKEPAQRIISLYSAHTENLFEIEAGDQIIGRGKSDVYPVEVLEKRFMIIDLTRRKSLLLNLI